VFANEMNANTMFINASKERGIDVLRNQIENFASTVSIDSVSYDVPMHFIRMKVEIRYLPDDMKNAYILHDGKCYYIRPTNKLENSRTKRENTPAIDYSLNGGLKDV
jgi:DNA polymerase III delta prime subunit